MKKDFKLREGETMAKAQNPIIGITGKGRHTYLWIGNNADKSKMCFATMSGEKTLRKFAKAINDALDNWKSIEP